MTLTERIIAYVQRHHPLSYTKLEGVVLSKGFSEADFMTALEQVHRSKEITVTQRQGEMYYAPTPPKAPPTVATHLSWVNDNYPRYEYEMPFPEIDYSHLFLRTKEERDAYLAAASGRPLHMVQSKKHHGHTRRENPVRDTKVLTDAQRALLAQSASYLQ